MLWIGIIVKKSLSNKDIIFNENLESVNELSIDYEVLPAEVDLGITNGNIPTDFYSINPCTIGYSYLRFEVNGNIKPCCVAKYNVGNINESDWREVWHSNAMTMFRKKTAKIHLEKFHKYHPDWLFCQQCSHLDINRENLKHLVSDE